VEIMLEKEKIEKIKTNAETIGQTAEQIENEKGMSWEGAVNCSLRIQRLSDEILSVLEKL
jgi:hypothetical protein